MSRTRSRIALRLTLAALATAVIVCHAMASGTPPAAGALTNEDVVRMTAARMPAEAIVKAIRDARTTAFDLEPDVVEELRRANVADSVIEAMRRAQPAPPAAPPTLRPPEGKLVLVFEGDRSKPYDWTAVAPARDREGDDLSLAFFAFCLDPTHVPDHWQALTPLAEGFPRHHLIWVQEAIVPFKQDSRGGLFYLDLPQSHELPIAAGRHPLMFGVAGRAGARAWVNMTSAEALVQAWPGADTRIRIAVRTKKGISGLAAGASPYTCKILEVDPPPSTAADVDP